MRILRISPASCCRSWGVRQRAVEGTAREAGSAVDSDDLFCISMSAQSRSENVSVWLATADCLRAPPLAENERADVCIVGAGIAGMTTAYLLALDGVSVVVI